MSKENQAVMYDIDGPKHVLVAGIWVRRDPKNGKLEVIIPHESNGINLDKWLRENAESIGYEYKDKANAAEARERVKKPRRAAEEDEPLMPHIEP